ncbi:hypothetical protein SteCoe_28707 [Stentor coeruleus]|uniref:Uncharacterized protein n=1 Tax=Stentor coeruleus TaxID=5963 RepID=A0A1R2B7K3_9CILI|nr:hypothetical protein SteCoe_28707 [Stentor coeruleus]
MEQHSYPLQRKWVIWEMWNQSKEFGSSLDSMGEVGEFQGLHEFWQHWNYLPHANPLMLFENPETKVKIIIESINQSIEAIGIFQDKIKPFWDDPNNKSGSSIYFEIGVGEIHRLKDIWDKLVFSLIGETLPYSEDIVGVRIVDKKCSYKYEVWCKFDGNANRFVNKALQIKDEIKELLGVVNIQIASHSSS